MPEGLPPQGNQRPRPPDTSPRHGNGRNQRFGRIAIRPYEKSVTGGSVQARPLRGIGSPSTPPPGTAMVARTTAAGRTPCDPYGKDATHPIRNS
ncbi:MAG: hypothetical protein FWD58_00780 [Firmicutes bacterium]|nr:hypothetical protein [Bacillota bacterium]